MAVLADLHIHSTFSDGSDTPAELVEMAKKAGLPALALVDHDTVDGHDTFMHAAAAAGIVGIPGVELSTSVNGLRIHILGYLMQKEHPVLTRTLQELSRARTHTTKLILNRLGELGLLKYPWDRVVERAGGKKWLCSTHVFESMLADGYYSSYAQFRDFYHTYFSKQSPAYMDVGVLTAEEAVKVIIEAGGIPVLAHPVLIGDDSQIAPLIQAGLKGIEVYYPAHSAQDVNRYLGITKRHNLLATGGTDWHGKMTERAEAMGETGITMDLVDELFKRR